ARRRRIDRAYQDELAVRLVLQRLDEIHRYLGFVVPIRLEIFGRDTKPLARDLEDRPFLGGLRNFNIGFRRLMLRDGPFLIGEKLEWGRNISGFFAVMPAFGRGTPLRRAAPR